MNKKCGVKTPYDLTALTDRVDKHIKILTTNIKSLRQRVEKLEAEIKTKKTIVEDDLK